MPLDVTGKAAPLAHPAHINAGNSLEDPDPDEVAKIDLCSGLGCFLRFFFGLGFFFSSFF